MDFKEFLMPNGQKGVRPTKSVSVTEQDFLDDLTTATSLTTADGKAALAYLASFLAQRLGEGENVSLDGIGSFNVSFTLDNDSLSSDHKLTARDIRVKRITFKAQPSLKRKIISNLSKSSSKLYRIDQQRQPLSIDERRQKAVSLAEQGEPFTTITYKHEVGVSMPRAYKDLSMFVEEGLLRVLDYGRYKLYCMDDSHN